MYCLWLIIFAKCINRNRFKQLISSFFHCAVQKIPPKRTAHLIYTSNEREYSNLVIKNEGIQRRSAHKRTRVQFRAGGTLLILCGAVNGGEMRMFVLFLSPSKTDFRNREDFAHPRKHPRKCGELRCTLRQNQRIKTGVE